MGATPVFVDIVADIYTMNPAKLELAINCKTKAIIPVSMFSQLLDIDTFNYIAAKRKIPMIEDGAQSFGSTSNCKKSYGTSLICSTSFFPAKPPGCYGDGGALFTDDDTVANNIRAIRTHGGL